MKIHSMRNSNRRLLAVIMAAMMIAGLQPAAFAADSTDTSSGSGANAGSTASAVTVTFDTESETKVDPVTVSGSMNMPADPVFTIYGVKWDSAVFDGWYTGRDGTGTQVTLDDAKKLAENTTLYAKWIYKWEDGTQCMMRTRALDLRSSEVAYNNNGSEAVFNPAESSASATTEGWSWDKDTMTLTLSQLLLTTSENIACRIPAGGKVVLVDGSYNYIYNSYNGDSYTTAMSYYSDKASDPALSISGAGKLLLCGGTSTSSTSGLYTTNGLEIKDKACVRIFSSGYEGKAAGMNSTGIMAAGGDVNIIGASAEAFGSASDADKSAGLAGSFGVMAKAGAVTVSGEDAMLSAYSDKADNACSIGLYSKNDITQKNGATIDIFSYMTGIFSETGIVCDDGITVEGKTATDTSDSSSTVTLEKVTSPLAGITALISGTVASRVYINDYPSPLEDGDVAGTVGSPLTATKLVSVSSNTFRSDISADDCTVNLDGIKVTDVAWIDEYNVRVTFSGTPAKASSDLISISFAGSCMGKQQGNVTTPNEKARWNVTAASEMAFTDVAAGDWFSDAVSYVAAKGLMKGVTDTSFEPQTDMSRAMLVTILYRLDGGKDASAQAAAFIDVAAGSWYADAVGWAFANGIVKGVSDTDFAPDASVTREQLASILYRYAKYKGYDVSVGEDTNVLSYDDAFSVSEYAMPAIQWACGAGLINGADNKLMPQGSATRAQVAAIAMRFCENVVK